jgi:multiple sugar transport system substrate-binding protein
MAMKVGRRRVLSAAGAGLLAGAGKAAAQGGRKRLQGVTLNVSCWSSTYPKLLTEYIPEFEEATGAKVNYETPSFPIYNQRMDVELSTGSSAYDVVNVTFIYAGRWVGSGWVTPLDDFIKDPAKTPDGWGADDFLSGTTASFKDRQGRLCAIPWIADVQMAGASRFDLIQKAGFKLPETFAEIEPVMKAVNRQSGVAGFLCENHYGWQWVAYLQGMGNNVFRAPPDDLMPVLDSPESIAAADLFGHLMREYGPDGVVSYTYDQVTATLKQARANYSTNNETFLVQMAQKDSRAAKTCGFSLMPAGPKGRFPGVAAHGWGIPAGSKQKDAAWEFITWAMSKDICKRMFNDKGYSSVTRRSIIEAPEFKSSLQYNGFDVAKLYLDTIERAGSGYMAYRTMPVFPQVDREIDSAIQSVITQQMTAAEAMKQAQANAIAQIQRAGVKL